MTFTSSQDQDLRTYAEAFNDYYQGERPDVEREDRDYVEYNDVEQVSDQDRAHIVVMDAIEAYDEDDLPPCGDPTCGDCSVCIPDDLGWSASYNPTTGQWDYNI